MGSKRQGQSVLNFKTEAGVSFGADSIAPRGGISGYPTGNDVSVVCVISDPTHLGSTTIEKRSSRQGSL